MFRKYKIPPCVVQIIVMNSNNLVEINFRETF